MNWKSKKLKRRVRNQVEGQNIQGNLIFLPWEPIKAIFEWKIWKNLTLHYLPKSFYLWIDLTKRSRNDPNSPQNLCKSTYYTKNSWNYWLQATNLKNSYLDQKCIIYSLYKIKFLWIPLLNANVAYEWPLRGSRMNCASFENMKIT